MDYVPRRIIRPALLVLVFRRPLLVDYFARSVLYFLLQADLFATRWLVARAAGERCAALTIKGLAH